MGSGVTVILTGRHPETVITDVRSHIERLESLWSRFRPDSEISHLNRRTGHEVTVSAETAELVEFMILGRRATRGRFDPTMLNSIIRVGYTGSFGADQPAVPTTIGFDFDSPGDTESIVVRRLDHRFGITLPHGTVLDPGGLKGLAADMVLRRLIDAGLPDALVSIGGDIAVNGSSPDPDHGCWTLNVLDPLARHDVSYVRLSRGGVATSSSMLRTFPTNQGSSHHIVDPRTRNYTANGVFGATVVAGSAAWAEVFSKVVMVDGRSALGELDDLGLGAMIVDVHGRAANRSFREFETHTTTGLVDA